jgi:hypothetical protein
MPGHFGEGFEAHGAAIVFHAPFDSETSADCVALLEPELFADLVARLERLAGIVARLEPLANLVARLEPLDELVARLEPGLLDALELFLEKV